MHRQDRIDRCKGQGVDFIGRPTSERAVANIPISYRQIPGASMASIIEQVVAELCENV